MKAYGRVFRGRRYTRRAAVAVQVAVMSTLILGFGALAVDVGAIYTVQTELQAAADSAALAAAGALMGEGGLNPDTAARAAAANYAARNRVRNASPLLAASDVEFGRAVLDPTTNRFTFEPSATAFDAVRVTVRRTADSPNGAVPLWFANIFGIRETELRARAAAVLLPRDIALVIDLSGSMDYDSQLRFYNRSDGGFSNLRDIWAALDGPVPSRPYMPGSELETEYADDLGPTYGWMTYWGDPLLPGSYTAAADPGLWYIRKSQNTNVTQINTLLVAAGYNAAERAALVSGSLDSTTTHWRNRCGVLLGLATWNSGKAGGRPGGNGDNKLDDFEVVWVPLPPYRVGWHWRHYIDYVQAGTSHSAFRYRYGLKTYTDFLLDAQRSFNQTNILWATPEEPLQAVKDAVQTLVTTIDELDSLDHLSLEVFATGSKHELDLTDNLQAVADLLYQRQAAHYDATTNIGGGLARAINELTSARARPAARKVILLMSDGVPNVDESGTYVGDGAPGAIGYALAKAQAAADLGMRIYTVSVGVQADRPLMQEIATIGGGQEFFAGGSPEEYTAQLAMIFRTLGGRRPVALIE